MEEIVEQLRKEIRDNKSNIEVLEVQISCLDKSIDDAELKIETLEYKNRKLKEAIKRLGTEYLEI